MSRLVGVLAGALLLIGAALVGWQLLTAAFPSFQVAGNGGPPSPAALSTPPTPSAARTPEPVPIAAMADFDPAGDPPEENPDRVDNAFDADPDTAWSTQTYFDPLELLKPGVGLAIDLGEAVEVSAVRLALSDGGADLELRTAAPGAQSAPTTLDAWQEVLSETGLDANPVLELDEAAETRFVLLWFTKLPPAGEDYRLEVAEVEVLS